MSGSVARNMSGLGVRNGTIFKPGTLVTGDPEDEIRRSVYRLAGRAFDARGCSTAGTSNISTPGMPASMTDSAAIPGSRTSCSRPVLSALGKRAVPGKSGRPRKAPEPESGKLF